MGIAPSVAVALLVLVANGVGARDEVAPQVQTDRTYLTFSCTTRLPGATLPPGTYLFVKIRSVGGQSLIDVYTADASRQVARVLGVESPNADTRQRDLSPASPEGVTGCPPVTQPRRGWFNTPNAYGIEFVYTRAESEEFAKMLGVQLPYSVLPVGDLGLVGAYPVAGAGRGTPLMAAGAGALVALPTQSSRLGSLIASVGTAFTPAHHLMVARMIAVERAGAVERERTLFEQVGKLLDAVQRAAREGDTAMAAKLASGLEATLVNLNPPVQALARRGILPPSRDFVLTLEQIGANVHAFARTLRP